MQIESMGLRAVVVREWMALIHDVVEATLNWYSTSPSHTLTNTSHMLTSVASNALLFRCIALISCVTVGSAIGIYSEILDEGHIKMYLCHTHCSSQWPPSRFETEMNGVHFGAAAAGTHMWVIKLKITTLPRDPAAFITINKQLRPSPRYSSMYSVCTKFCAGTNRKKKCSRNFPQMF